MKIGILTWFNRGENCGQILQAFSLYYKFELIFGKGSCVIFDYQYGYRNIYLNKVIWPLYKIYMILKARQFKRSFRFIQFTRKYATTSKPIFSTSQLENIIDRLNINSVVLGSDQIWNPQSGDIPDAMILNVKNKIKRLSYSPSMCSINDRETYDLEIRKVAKSIDGFEFVGVRERTAKELLNRYCTKEINVLLDPVFMLSADEWVAFENDEYVVPDNYALLYCVGDVPNYVKDMIDKIKHTLRVNTIVFIKTSKNQNIKHEWKVLNDVGPSEFIKLIEKAKCIICDSFHMSAFSIIFRKNFYCFTAVKKDHVPNIDRIVCLLERFGLEERLINENNYLKIEKIDYSYHDSRIVREISSNQEIFKKMCCLMDENLILNA